MLGFPSFYFGMILNQGLAAFAKTGKKVVRQTTLFGMPIPPLDKEKRAQATGKKKAAQPKPLPTETSEVPESSQVMDIPMSDATTLAGDSQDVTENPEDSPPQSTWEETQLEDSSEVRYVSRLISRLACDIFLITLSRKHKWQNDIHNPTYATALCSFICHFPYIGFLARKG